MLSSENLSITRAEHYYDEENGLPCLRIWYGKGVAVLHLPHEVTPDDFQQLIRGHDLQGNLLHGKPPDLERHRAGTDFTFSAPKSVSLAATCNLDVLEAHHHAVLVSLGVLESYAQARVWDGKQQVRVPTQNIVAAIAPHRLSREQDPQLHTHVFVLNATQLADANWRALSNEEMVSHKKLVGQIYQNQLAYNLRQSGYEIEAKPHGQFELKGFSQVSQDFLGKFSTRRQQRDDYLARTDQPKTPKAKRQAVLRTRKGKKVTDWDALEHQWQQRMTPAEIELLNAPLNPKLDLEEQGKTSAVTTATEGIKQVEQKGFMFRRETIARFILENYLGQQSWNQIQQALQETPQLQPIDETQNLYTTPVATAIQQSCLQRIEQGKGAMQAIASPAEIAEVPTEFLTPIRRKALERTVTTTDQFTAWQDVHEGDESQGSYAEKIYRQVAQESGYTIWEFDGADLSKLDIESERLPLAQTPEVWVVQRAETLSVSAMHTLLETAQQEQARVLLLGDTRRLSPKDVGNPLKVLQQEGLTTINFERSDKTTAIISPDHPATNLETTNAQTQKNEASDAGDFWTSQNSSNWERWLGERLATRLAASVSENRWAGATSREFDRITHDLASSLDNFGGRDAIANYDPESIARSVADFAEQRTFDRIVPEIIGAVGRIHKHIRGIGNNFGKIGENLRSVEPDSLEQVFRKLAAAEIARSAQQMLDLAGTTAPDGTRLLIDAPLNCTIGQHESTLTIKSHLGQEKFAYDLQTRQYHTKLSASALEKSSSVLRERIEKKTEELRYQNLATSKFWVDG